MLGIEKCLLNGLPNLIPPTEAVTLNNSKVGEIAAEPPEVVEERTKAVSQKEALDDVIRICRSYVIREPGMSHAINS